MSYKRKVISDYPNFYKEIRVKDNYNLKGSYNLIFEDVDIYQAECIKVINEKIKLTGEITNGIHRYCR